VLQWTSTTFFNRRAGNRHGLLVPMGTSDAELQQLKNSLPDDVVIRRVDERLSALGNVIACNDYVALVHPDLDKVRLNFDDLSNWKKSYRKRQNLCPMCCGARCFGIH
jgi:hypothetical protein